MCVSSAKTKHLEPRRCSFYIIKVVVISGNVQITHSNCPVKVKHKKFVFYRMVFHKIWRCQHHSRNKTAGRHVTNCPAMVDIKIKMVTTNTRRNDVFLQRSVPLPAVVKISHGKHNHSTECADALRLPKSSDETRATFNGYFQDGMTAAEAMRLHESKLIMEENGLLHLANAALNPLKRTVYYWYDVWRKNHFGHDVDPIAKVHEKMAFYTAQGT